MCPRQTRGAWQNMNNRSPKSFQSKFEKRNQKETNKNNDNNKKE